MGRFFYDTEFLEDGRTIELISIGIVSDTGAEYYAVNADIDTGWEETGSTFRRICGHQWLMANVVPHLPLVRPAGEETFTLDTSDPLVKPKWVIRNEVREFLLTGHHPLTHPDVELWAYYGAYDHVALMQLWGRMVNKPPGIPMWTHDIMQEAQRLGLDDTIGDTPQSGTTHNALDDARWCRDMWRALRDSEARNLNDVIATATTGILRVNEIRTIRDAENDE